MVGAVVDQGLIMHHHFKKWIVNVPTFCTKKCRKLLWQIWLAQKEEAVLVVETPSKSARTSEPEPKG